MPICLIFTLEWLKFKLWNSHSWKVFSPLSIKTQEYQLLHSFQLHWLNTAKACQTILPDRCICSSICSAHTDYFASVPEGQQKKREWSWLHTWSLSVKVLLICKEKKKGRQSTSHTKRQLCGKLSQSHHHQESWSFMKIKSVERCSKADLFVPIFETFWKIPPTLSVSLEVFLGVYFWVSKDNLVLANKTCTTVS